MTNEAVLLYELEPPLPFTVADGTGIEKGAVLKMSSPRTAALATATTDMIAGVAATEKIANDGVTSLGVYRRGWFKMAVSGAATIGQALTIQDAAAPNYNWVTSGSMISSGSTILGYALESTTTSGTIAVDLNIGGSAVSGGIA